MGKLKVLLPTLSLFVLINGILLILIDFLIKNEFNITILFAGNFFIFCLSVISLMIHRGGARAGSVHMFVRYFYLSSVIKIMLVLLVVLVYALTADKINRPSVIACMLFYLAYAVLEVTVLIRKTKTDG